MQREFEQYLKNSDYLRDVMTTHRNAVAEIFGSLILLVNNGDLSPPTVKAWMRKLDEPGAGPSIDVERRRIVALMGDYLKQNG